jgi:dihydrofolate reductase
VRKLVYYVAVTLDGFIAGPDGGDLSGASYFLFPQDMVEFIVTEYPETLPGAARQAMGVDAPGTHFDTALQGRASYEIGLAAGVTNAYPHLRNLVFSTTMCESPDPTVELVATDALERARALKAEDGLDIWLVGGGKLAHALLPDIDRLVLKQHAALIGSGIPMFDGPFEPQLFPPDGPAAARLGDTDPDLRPALSSGPLGAEPGVGAHAQLGVALAGVGPAEDGAQVAGRESEGHRDDRGVDDLERAAVAVGSRPDRRAEDDEHDRARQPDADPEQRAGGVEAPPGEREQERREVRACRDSEGERHEELDVEALPREDRKHDRDGRHADGTDARDPQLVALGRLPASHDVRVDVVRDRARRRHHEAGHDGEVLREQRRGEVPALARRLLAVKRRRRATSSW